MIEQETKKKDILIDIQKQQRNRLVASILQNGLQPAKQLAEQGNLQLASRDKEDEYLRTKIHGCFFYSENHTGLKAEILPYKPMVRLSFGNATQLMSLRNLERTKSVEVQVHLNMFASRWSMLPTPAERYGEDTEQTRNPSRVSDRVQNTFLIVAAASNVSLERFYPNAEVNKTIFRQQFDEIIIPESLTDVINIFKSDGFSVQTVPLVTYQGSDSDFFVQDQGYQIPDYRRYVLAAMSKSLVPLFVHGVRLPTLEDVTGFQTKKD